MTEALYEAAANRELVGELHTCREQIKSLANELDNRSELLRLAARSEHSLEQVFFFLN